MDKIPLENSFLAELDKSTNSRANNTGMSIFDMKQFTTSEITVFVVSMLMVPVLITAVWLCKSKVLKIEDKDAFK